jgi:hypothetical protein
MDFQTCPSASIDFTDEQFTTNLYSILLCVDAPTHNSFINISHLPANRRVEKIQYGRVLKFESIYFHYSVALIPKIVSNQEKVAKILELMFQLRPLFSFSLLAFKFIWGKEKQIWMRSVSQTSSHQRPHLLKSKDKIDRLTDAFNSLFEHTSQVWPALIHRTYMSP